MSKTSHRCSSQQALVDELIVTETARIPQQHPSSGNYYAGSEVKHLCRWFSTCCRRSTPFGTFVVQTLATGSTVSVRACRLYVVLIRLKADTPTELLLSYECVRKSAVSCHIALEPSTPLPFFPLIPLDNDCLQAGVSKPKAVKALKAADGDIVSAIMELTM